MATHSNILAWKIPWTQEPGGREAIVHGVTKSQTQLSTQTSVKWGFPCGSDCKQSSCNAGDLGLIPGQGRSPGESNGYLLQYPWLENSTDRGAWQATVHGGHKESDTTERLTQQHNKISYMTGMKQKTREFIYLPNMCSSQNRQIFPTKSVKPQSQDLSSGKRLFFLLFHCLPK